MTVPEDALAKVKNYVTQNEADKAAVSAKRD